jgi:hypothetical protein
MLFDPIKELPEWPSEWPEERCKTIINDYPHASATITFAPTKPEAGIHVQPQANRHHGVRRL